MYIRNMCLLKGSWNSFGMPLCPLGSLPPFFLCWRSRAADSQPASGSVAFLPTQSLMCCLDTCLSHSASVTNLFVVTSCVLEIHFCRAFPCYIWLDCLIYQQWSGFFPSFSLWAQFCSWGQADSCWCMHGVLLASERQGAGEDICLGRATKPRSGSSSVSCYWGEQKQSFPDVLLQTVSWDFWNLTVKCL